MKIVIALSIYWFISAMIRIPLVESWAFPPDGTSSNWWNIVGIRIALTIAFAEIAHLRRRLS